MKKAMTIIMLIIVLSGCSTNAGKNDSPKPGSWYEDDLSVFSVETGDEVYIGMDKASAEKILGMPTDTTAFFTYPNDINVLYRENRIALIILGGDSFQTYRGVKLGDEYKTVETKYGEEQSATNSAEDKIYIIHNNNAEYELVRKDISIDSTTHYQMDFRHKDNVVCSITIGDCLAVYKMK